MYNFLIQFLDKKINIPTLLQSKTILCKLYNNLMAIFYFQYF